MPARYERKLQTKAGEVIQQIAKPLEQCSADELWRGEAALELQALEAVTKLLREVERKLEAFAASDESVKLLRSIPGVGRCTAEVVVAYLDNPQRFENGRQVSAYAGLVPKQFQSGETDRQGRISRPGRLCCGRCWSKQAGSCCVTTRGPNG